MAWSHFLFLQFHPFSGFILIFHVGYFLSSWRLGKLTSFIHARKPKLNFFWRSSKDHLLVIHCFYTGKLQGGGKKTSPRKKVLVGIHLWVHVHAYGLKLLCISWTRQCDILYYLYNTVNVHRCNIEINFNCLILYVDVVFSRKNEYCGFGSLITVPQYFVNEQLHLKSK